MPMVNSDIYNQLIKSRNQKNIIVPTYNGQQGNPVLFDKSMKEKIMNISGDARNGSGVDGSLVVSMEINGTSYQGVLFAQTTAKRASSNSPSASSQPEESSA